ncbi:MAG TPA: cellulase family glycosylhydrolase [Solirubrobacteraceae bacterium]|nr:cellulase family glycosylhydrolase [Solirubrobacteraceae bacterium]
MGPQTLRCLRWLLPGCAGIVCAILVSGLGQAPSRAAAVPGQAPSRAAAVPLSIAVQGNHFVNRSGQTVRLLGVNHASFEYACVQGWGYNDGHMDAADAAAIASWHATAVRVPLNEDCWLGINGQPNSSQGANPPLTMGGYRQAVEHYVADLNADGIYVILDLHWTAPGASVADGQRPMPDDHSGAFWTSVASTFKDNAAVVFDAFNEPYSPDAINDPGYRVTWDCWRNGTANHDCFLPASNAGQPPDNNTLYGPVGMQYLVDQIRATGATQPILLGGLTFANDLSQWLANEPSDPDHQLAASYHGYQGEPCGTLSCWDSTIAPVAAQVPVVTGEFDEDDFDSATCANRTPSTFDADYMNWADQHGVSYLAWGWEPLSPQYISDQGCRAYYLTSDPSGTPAVPNGTALHDHLAALADAGTTSTTGKRRPHPPAPALRAFKATVTAGGAAVRLTLRANQKSDGVLSGQTVNSFPTTAASHRRHRVSLGSVRFKLDAGTSKTVVLKLSRASRKLLSRQHKLKVRITVTLTNAGRRRAISHHALSLKAPARRRR